MTTKMRKAAISLADQLLRGATTNPAEAALLKVPLLPRWVDADGYPLGPAFAPTVADREASLARGFDRWLIWEGPWRS